MTEGLTVEGSAFRVFWVLVLKSAAASNSAFDIAPNIASDLALDCSLNPSLSTPTRPKAPGRGKVDELLRSVVFAFVDPKMQTKQNEERSNVFSKLDI